MSNKPETELEPNKPVEITLEGSDVLSDYFDMDDPTDDIPDFEAEVDVKRK